MARSRSTVRSTSAASARALGALFVACAAALTACGSDNNGPTTTASTSGQGGDVSGSGGQYSVGSSTGNAGGGAPAGVGGGAGTGGDNGDGICLLHNCTSDDHCSSCSNGRTHCDVAENRCVACTAATASGCPDGEYCSSWGNCVPNGTECMTDAMGNPQVACSANADCIACDPAHQICDTATSKCVGCVPGNTSECQSTDACVDNECAPECPATCDVDADCSNCGTNGGVPATSCHAHKCAQCSITSSDCPNGQQCGPQGACVTKCGSTGTGVCTTDADCAACGGSATKCHKPINSSEGKCGVVANGCSDLGTGAAVLPEPFSQVTNLCSNDGDCAGVGIEFNVGELLRDVTGIDGIGDANIDYPMNACADVSIGAGDALVNCGVCVPCEVDSDCQNIDIDALALEAFGPIGGIASAFLLDQVFGPNDHEVKMYCETVTGSYGICAPCPGILYDCGLTDDPGTGQCTHDTCTAGDPLRGTCGTCEAVICALDPYCCTVEWDQACVDLVLPYCYTPCVPCSHDECTEGDPLDPSCSNCVVDVCDEDEFCCTMQWDLACIVSAEDKCGLTCM